MPTWFKPSKNTRSPGCRPARSTRVPIPYCAAAKCGSEIPSCAYTYITSPEQSKPLGVAPPQTYGTPRYRRAIVAASGWPGPAGAVGPGSGGGAGAVVVVGAWVVVVVGAVVVTGGGAFAVAFAAAASFAARAAAARAAACCCSA